MKTLIAKTALVSIIIIISSFRVSADYLYDSYKERIDATQEFSDGFMKSKNQDKEIKIALSNFNFSTFNQYPLPKQKDRDYVKRGYSIEFDISQLKGHTTYEIGGMTDNPIIEKLHFPISKLEFPLNSYIASLRTNIDITKSWNFIFGLKMNISSNAGTTKDSDWGYYWYIDKYEFNNDDPWFDQNSLDIYSESEADLDVLIVDFNLRYHIFKNPKFQFFSGIGYKNQSFDYEISNLDQRYPSFEYYDNLPDTPKYLYDPNIVGFDPSAPDYCKGQVLLYNISYNIPYMEIGTRFRFNRFGCEARCGYSPIVNIRDEDDHLVRVPPKQMYGNCDGDALILSFKGYINFYSGWFLSLGYSYTKISTEGIQTQYIYKEIENQRVYSYPIKIDQKIKSLQRLSTFSFGYLW